LQNYDVILSGVVELLDTARRTSARAVNSIMTATYWEVGRRIVEFEQGGEKRAEYGGELLARLAKDLSTRFGRGFSRQNLQNMRQFYLAAPPNQICQTPSGNSSESETQATPSAKSLPSPSGELQIRQTVSGKLPDKRRAPDLLKSANLQIRSAASNIFQTMSAKYSPLAVADLARAFPLPWSHYVQLISHSRSPEAFAFYQAKALRGGWSVRQLRRQMDSQFYERTALSKNKTKMLREGAVSQPGDALTADEEIKDPLVLEFLGLKDEYSESDLEGALVHHLEHFLLELGNDFAFVARQRRLRIDDEWYRVDLLLFHRRLRCLVVIDLKLGRFTHADAGQMHLYLNYAREHWAQPDENPPVGMILCSGKGGALVRYATDNLPNKVLVREYLTALPDEKRLAAEIETTREKLEQRHRSRGRCGRPTRLTDRRTNSLAGALLPA
jgi:predicted nuclease of restriction endonuclease-like (RecB) superfamily